MQSGAADFRRARQTQDSTVFVNAASHFDAASSFGPDSAAAFQNKAYALINAGRQNDAIAPLEQYIQKSDSVSTDGYAILAQLYLTNDRGDDAINLLQEAVQTYPADNELQSLLLTAFQQAGRPDDAMNQVARQVEQNPDNPTYRYNYGSLLLRADRFDEAIEQLSQAIELQGSPETASDSADAARAHYNLGAAHVNKAAGLIDSIRTIQDTLRNDRQNLADQQVQEFQERAQQLDEQRRTLFSDAIAPLEEARALNPAGANQGVQEQSLCSALFRAYAQTEQVEKAEEVQECAGLSDDALEQDEESSSQQQP
jgi:tetratricopeptide (TPR) repeat protein